MHISIIGLSSLIVGDEKMRLKFEREIQDVVNDDLSSGIKVRVEFTSDPPLEPGTVQVHIASPLEAKMAWADRVIAPRIQGMYRIKGLPLPICWEFPSVH